MVEGGGVLVKECAERIAGVVRGVVRGVA